MEQWTIYFQQFKVIMNPVMFGELNEGEKFRLIQTNMLWMKCSPTLGDIPYNGMLHNAFCREDSKLSGNYFAPDTLVLREEQ